VLPASVALAETVAAAFPPPPGSDRVVADAFGEHVRGLPLLPPGTPVVTWDGRAVDMHEARVVDLPLPAEDLQQCADSILRIRATWVRDTGGSPAFHHTDGRLSRFAGSGLTWERWLRHLFAYAGTMSLPRDTVADVEPSPGDILVAPGSPGHAVLLLDVARAGDRTWVLVGQGYMPAMRFSVARGPDAGWFPVLGERLEVWPIALAWSTLRRW
jgi:hypothetical protein